MGLPKSMRFDNDLEILIEEYLRKNKIKFSQLLQLSISKFITEEQNITLSPVSSKKWQQTIQKAYKKHKGAMEKLK